MPRIEICFQKILRTSIVVADPVAANDPWVVRHRDCQAGRALECLTTLADVVIVSNIRAVALVRRRVVLAEDAFAEVAIWRVPRLEPPSRHRFEYRLAYVVAGECVLRYDNERGKGDQRHVGAVDVAHAFSTPDQLMADFASDSARWNREHGRS